MPRNVDPGTIVVGAGLAPEGTVEDNSLRYPERDVDPLRVHLHDTSRAHMAVAIGIDDAGHCYTSDEVEGALQEICAAAGASRMNGMVNGGYFVELGPPSTAAIQAAISGGGVGTLLTLVDPTTVLVNTHVLHLGSMTITLPDDAVSFVYVDCDGTSATYETLVSTLAPPPQIDSGGWPGVEHVMIAKITTVGGIVTAYQDARFFVADLDRKLAYSVRAVPAEPDNDLYAEACFVTLEASLFWMEWYHNNAMNGQDTRTRILLRGTQTVFAPLVVPLNNVVFQGDGDAKIVFPGGFAGTTLFDVSDRAGVEFRDLEFVSSAATNNTAIWANGATTASGGLKVTNCQFVHTGGGAVNRWTTGISVESSASAPSWILVRDCQMVVSGTGVRIDSGASCTIQGCLVAGSNDSNSVGIDLPATQHGMGSDNRVLDCQIRDCATAIRAIDSKRLHVEGCQLEADDDGIIIRAAAQNFNLEENVIEGTTVKLADTTTALCGIIFDHSAIVGLMTKNAVINCLIENQRTGGWIGVVPAWGIDFRSFGGDEIGVLNRISGCTIQGFNNPAAAIVGISGGVRFDAAADQTRIVDTAFHLCGNGIYFSAGSGNVAQGVSVEGCKYTASTNTIASRCAGFTFLYQFDELSIIGNTLHCLGNEDGSQGAMRGMYVANPEDSAGTGLRIANNQVTGMGHPGASGAPSVGIQVDGFWTNVNVSDNTIDGYIGGGGNFPNGAGVSFTAQSLAPRDVVVSGNAITRCLHGITAAGVNSTHLASTYNITGNTISYCAGPISDPANVVMLDRAVFGIAMEFCEDFMVSSNVISDCGTLNFPNGGAAAPAGDESTIGICALNCTQYSIHGNRIHELISTGQGVTIPIQARNDIAGVGAAGTWASRAVSICNNEIKGAGLTPTYGTAGQLFGIVVSGSASGDAPDATYIISDLTISDNTITGLRAYDNLGQGSTGINVLAFANAEISKVTVHGNLVSGCEWYSIWLNANATMTAAGFWSVIRDSNVSNNVVGVQHSVSAAGDAGIYVSAIGAGRIQYANINNNNISNVPDRGIHLKSHDDNSILSGIRVVGNTIPYIPVGNHGSFGIELESLNDIKAEVQDVVVSGNTIGGRLVFDTSAPSYFMVNTGIKVFNEECSQFLRVHVDDNEIAATVYGVLWQVASQASPGQNLGVRWASINRNTIHYAPQDGISVFEFRPIFVDSFGAHWEDAEFIGNQVRSACTPLNGPAVPLTVHLYGDSDPNTAPYHFTNIKINDNTAENTSQTNNVPNTESILLHIASAQMDVHGIQINRNTTQGGGINCLLDQLDADHDEISDINICGNTVNGNLARIGIKFNTKDVPTANPQPINNVKIDGNTIESLATGITFAPTSESSYGIFVGTVGGEAPIRGCSISNNTVDGTLSTEMSAAWGVTGIKMMGCGCRGMSIHGNTMVNLRGADKQARGIWYYCLSGDSTQALTVDGNTVNGAGGSGIELQFGGGAAVDAGEDDSISVSNNNLRLVTAGDDPGIPGILIHAVEGTDTKLKNVQIHGNQVEVGDDQLGIEVAADGWDHNYSISVSNNTTTKNYGKIPRYGIRMDHPLTAHSVTVDGNECTAYQQGGIYMNPPADSLDFSISRNVLRTGNATKSGTLAAIKMNNSAVSSQVNLAIDGNIIAYTNPSAIQTGIFSYWSSTSVGAAARNWSMSGNKTHDCTNGIVLTADIIIPALGEPLDVYNLRIDNNQIDFHAAAAGYGIKVGAGTTGIEWLNISVSRNQVVMTPTNDFTGIWLEFIDIPGAGAISRNRCWDVCDNTVMFTNPINESTTQQTEGIRWATIADWSQQLQFSRNTVSGHGSLGIGLVSSGGDCRELQVHNNIVHSGTNTYSGPAYAGDIVLEWDFGGTLKSLSMCGNLARNINADAGRMGFRFNDGGVAGVTGKWMICNNQALNYAQTLAVNATITSGAPNSSTIVGNMNNDMGADPDNWDGGATWTAGFDVVNANNNDVP